MPIAKGLSASTVQPGLDGGCSKVKTPTQLTYLTVQPWLDGERTYDALLDVMGKKCQPLKQWGKFSK